MPDKQNYNHEIYRKILHLFYTSSIVLFLWYFGKESVSFWFIIIAVILSILDYGRQHIVILNRIFMYLFSILGSFDNISPISLISYAVDN